MAPIQRCIKYGRENLNICVSFCDNFHLHVPSFAFVINFSNCNETLWTPCRLFTYGSNLGEAKERIFWEMGSSSKFRTFRADSDLISFETRRAKESEFSTLFPRNLDGIARVRNLIASIARDVFCYSWYIRMYVRTCNMYLYHFTLAFMYLCMCVRLCILIISKNYYYIAIL